MHFLFTFLIILLLVLSPFGAAAQEIPGVGNPLSIRLSTDTPAPFQEITARAESFLINLDRATLSWSVGGQTVASGRGETEITFTVDGIGSATTVRVTATEDGASFTAEEVLRPAVVDLLWEADSYTPTLYRGKALPGSQSIVRIVALPSIVVSGRRIPSEELSFVWKIGSRVLGNQSGVGRNFIEIEGPRLFGSVEGEVSVSVSTANDSVEALGFADIRSVPSQILFYENDPLLGIRYEQALGEVFELQNDEVRITAHPFFFSGETRTHGGEHDFSWAINGQGVENPLSDQSSIILRQTGGAGRASVSLMIQNMREILQRARESFDITYSGNRESTF